MCFSELCPESLRETEVRHHQCNSNSVRRHSLLSFIICFVLFITLKYALGVGAWIFQKLGNDAISQESFNLAMSSTERLDGGGAGKSGYYHHLFSKNTFWFPESNMIDKRKIKIGRQKQVSCCMFYFLLKGNRLPSLAPFLLGGISPTTRALCLGQGTYFNS